MASTLVSIGNVHFSNEDTLKLMKQLERYLHLDKLIPSYHKTITVACLKTMQELQATKKIPIDYSVFRDFLKLNFKSFFIRFFLLILIYG